MVQRRIGIQIIFGRVRKKEGQKRVGEGVLALFVQRKKKC